MTNLIFNGDDPNTTLPNAPSINSFTTLSYSDVYGNLDGSGVTIDTDGAMLPEGFRDLQVWKDFMSCVEQVLGSPIASYLQSLLGMREPYFASTDPSIDRVTLLKIMDFIGFKYAQNDIFDDDDLRRFVRHTPLFWMEKGNRNFIQYMSFVINAQLSMQYLWTQDYVNFYPEGSPEIGKLITDPSQNLVANQQVFAAGGTSNLSFTLSGPNGLPIDSVSRQQSILSSVKFWQSDGVTSSAQLLDANGIPVPATNLVGLTSVHKTDYFGRALLSQGTRTNYLINSQGIGSTGWTNNASATAVQNNGVAPDGTTTAALVTSNGVSNSSGFWRSCGSIATSVSQIFCGSVGVKYSSGTTSAIQMSLEGSAFTTPVRMIFNPQLGTVTYASTNIITSRIINCGNGWWRIAITGAAQAVGNVNLTLYSGTTATVANWLWGAMVSTDTDLTSLIKTTTATVTAPADYTLSGSNVVFPSAPILGNLYDWDGTVVPSPVLYASSTWAGVDQLYPTARTNLMTNSTTVGSSGWTTSGVTVTTGQVTLDGTTTANKITATAATGYVRSAAVTVATSTYYTDSIYVNTTGMTSTQTMRVRMVDSTTPATVRGSVDFQLNTTTSGGVTVQSLISTANAGGATFGIYPTPIAGWYRVSITVNTSTSTGVFLDLLPDVTNGTGSVTAAYGMFEYGLKYTKYISTFTSTVSVTDYTLTGSTVTVPSTIPASTNLLWSGVYNQLGTWYQTSHVYIVYDVNKFASTVNSGFSSQQAMEQFFYSIAPIELVVRGFVLNLTLPPTNLYLAGDVHIRVLQPTNVDAANLYPNALYPLPQ